MFSSRVGDAGAWHQKQLRKQLGAIFDRLKTQILKRTDQLRDFVEEAAQSKAIGFPNLRRDG